jgi:AraC family transcriptional regulator
LIFRYMPPTWDVTFRPRFYERWGRESAVISAITRRAEYPEFRQLLSIKAAWGGVEEYFVDRQRIAVDDDHFLVLNAGRCYASAVKSCEPVHSFSIFFGPGLLEQVRRALTSSTEKLLDASTREESSPIQFSEHLRAHDRFITPVLRHIQRVVDAEPIDELWLDEQLNFLAQRLLRLHFRDLEREVPVPARRQAARKELQRRLGMGVNFMNSHYQEPIGLTQIAAAAHLSPHHFLRAFKVAHGQTPSAYLNRKRVRVAMRLMESSSWSLLRIAFHVGFGSRTTLYRHLKAAGHGRLVIPAS